MSESRLLGAKVGHFRIVENIGAGGMGSVYVGLDEKLDRRVALKVLQEDQRLSPEARARFLREARILSQLQHPNICQIYDYIETDERDFLVLELVQGESLKEVFKRGPSPALRMQIAEQTAQALIAAHEKNIVHRDLKPGNVMLTREGQVKLLDFGLARSMHALSPEPVPTKPELPPVPPKPEPAASQSPSPSGTITIEEIPAQGPGDTVSIDRVPTEAVAPHTETKLGTVMGTLSYMSPEQARGETVTAASDMYSYGLLLQELFTGRPPYEAHLSLEEHLTKASRGDTLPVDESAGSDLAALINRLKSLAPGARPTAADTASRLQWIRETPKRRLKKAAAIAGFVGLAVVAGGMSYQAYRISQANERANREAEASRQVSEFLVGLFEVSDPGEARGNAITAREILDQGARRIELGLKDQPLTQARLMDVMGVVYRELGLYDEAARLLRRARETRVGLLGEKHLDVAQSLDNLALVLRQQGRYDEARPLFERSVEIHRSLSGPDHPGLAQALNHLAGNLQLAGDYAGAESLYLRALAIYDRAGTVNADLGDLLASLGLLHLMRGEPARAQAVLERAITVTERVRGPDHPDVTAALNNLALVFDATGEFERSEALSERALAIREAVLGPDHPDVAKVLNNLAINSVRREDYDEARSRFERVLKIQEKALGLEHPDLATALANLAFVCNAVGEYPRAEQLLGRALLIKERGLGPDNPELTAALGTLAHVYLARGAYPRAEAFFRRALAIDEKSLGPRHPDITLDLNNVATACWFQGKLEQAEPLFRRALDIQQGGPPTGSVNILNNLAGLCADKGTLDEAQALYERSIAVSEEQLAKDAHNRQARMGLVTALLGLGSVQRRQAKEPSAVVSWTRALAIAEELTGGSETVAHLDRRAKALLFLGRVEEARPLVEKLLGKGRSNPEFLELCRVNGLLPAPGRALDGPAREG